MTSKALTQSCPQRAFPALLAGIAVLACGPVLAAAPTLGPDTGIRWNLTPGDVTTACKSGLESARAAIKVIDARDPRTVSFAAGLGAVEALTADLSDALAAPSSLFLLAPDKDVREASTQCSNDYAEFGVELSTDPAIYALAQAAAAQAQTTEEKQLAKIYIENGRRTGAGLDAATRARVSKLFNELNKLQTDYARAIAEDTTAIDLSAAELASLPATLTSNLKPGPHGTAMPVNESTYMAFLQTEALGAARLRYLTAYKQRGGTANVQRLTKAVALRQQLAKLLGFKSWAAYRLESKMAQTPERAIALLDQVNGALLPRSRNETAVLAALKRASGDRTPFIRSDYYYFEQQLEKTRYSVDNEQVRQYFPVDKVVPAVLDIYAHLLGVRFEPVAPAQAWAPGIIEYGIYDADSGDAIGWIYLDLYPREGKYDHFANFPIRSGRVLADGSYSRPVTGIVGNWPVSQAGKPALLSHEDVVTFFHEFGHLMHCSLSHTRFATLFGANVRLDFVEAPSQMLENWMWQPAVLRKISSHVDSGEPLPDDLIGKIIAARHVADGDFWATQTFYAKYDLQLHNLPGKPEPTALWFRLKKQMTSFPETPGTYPEASFGHLMGGYDSGYYSYTWANVYAQDMFSVFLKEGLDNPVVGRRYRETILVPGGSEEPDVLVRRFLGRELSFTPFYQNLGIGKP